MKHNPFVLYVFFLDRLMYYTRYLNIVIFKKPQTIIKKRNSSLFVPSCYKEGLNTGIGISLLKGSFSFFADMCINFSRDYFSVFAVFP